MANNCSASDASKPRIEIVEQPQSRGLRFRYECEGRSAGSITGESSSDKSKTYPTIKIHNTGGRDVIVVVSCITAEPPYRAHPHSLVGKECNKGVCTTRVKGNDKDSVIVQFSSIGIQCAKKKEVEQQLKKREEIRVDPFSKGFDHAKQAIDLNQVRLCFQAFLPDDKKKFTRIISPAVSTIIHDKKAMSDLNIARVSQSSGPACGDTEVFLLCEKVNKEDIAVQFYEGAEGPDESPSWVAKGVHGPGDVHRQYAIVFRSPPYRDPNITNPVYVKFQLFRATDQVVSNSLDWTYYPINKDPEELNRKRRKPMDGNEYVLENSAIARGISQVGRHKATASAGFFGNTPILSSAAVGQQSNFRAKDALRNKIVRGPSNVQSPLVTSPPGGAAPMQLQQQTVLPNSSTLDQAQLNQLLRGPPDNTDLYSSNVATGLEPQIFLPSGAQIIQKPQVAHLVPNVNPASTITSPLMTTPGLEPGTQFLTLPQGTQLVATTTLSGMETTEAKAVNSNNLQMLVQQQHQELQQQPLQPDSLTLEGQSGDENSISRMIMEGITLDDANPPSLGSFDLDALVTGDEVQQAGVNVGEKQVLQ